MARAYCLSCAARPRGRRNLFAAARLFVLFAVLWLASGNAAYAITREIYDCGDPNGDTACYLDFLDDGYFYGRSEGEPPRGPNPLVPPYTGSTDVDTLYDLVPSVNQYYLDKFGRNGPNNLGGTGNGSSLPYDVFRAFANADGSATGATACGGAGGAFASSTGVAFCRGSTNLDALGHETSHIFVRFLRQNPDSSWVALFRAAESGTLNEGMADFFGEAFERYVTGSNDWLFTVGPNNRVVRDLANPPSVNQGEYPSPDRYLSPDFYSASAHWVRKPY